MRTEWRSNIWMIVELTIVGLIVAIISMLLAQMIYKHTRPIGYDLTDVYVGSTNVLSKDADDYVKYDNTELYFNDLKVILNKIKANQYVEEVAGGNCSMPYNYNFSGTLLTYCSGSDTLVYYGNSRYFTPELVHLIRLTGPNGETTEQLAKSIERGEILVSPHNDNAAFGRWSSCEPYKIKGKTMFFGNDSTNTTYIANVCYGIARDDYEGVNGGCIILPLSYRGNYPSEIVVRVKPGMGRKFMETLNTQDLSQGNVYVTNFTSIDDMRDECQRGIDTSQRDLVICAVFLLVAVFLGFLGSFWFRTQQRVPEIALRKVNGATQWQIFSRLISEGLVLLLISAIIFTPLYFYIATSDIISTGFTATSKLPEYMAYAATLAVLAAMIVAGIWFPARKAMKVEPANALKDQ
jgi:putative ABC transport system permease protein